MGTRRDQAETISHAIFDQRYEILETIGRGRNSVVYKARLLGATSPSSDEKDENVIALKVLTGHSKDPEQNIQRMKREALAMLSARHANVIRLNDYVISKTGSEICYLSMEYADRGDLLLMLERSPEPLKPTLVLQLIHQLLSGLEAIHNAGIIHRDIKPENILLTSEGFLKIADFSIACLPIEESPSGQHGIGTIDYLAPENLDSGIVDECTDIYAVGITAFQLLTKHLPFTGETLSEQLNNKMSGKRHVLEEFIPDCPQGLDTLIGYALSNDPAKRFHSASQFREAIEKYLDGNWNGKEPSAGSANRSSQRARKDSKSFREAGIAVPSDQTFKLENDELLVNSSLLARAREADRQKFDELSEADIDSSTANDQPIFNDNVVATNSIDIDKLSTMQRGQYLSFLRRFTSRTFDSPRARFAIYCTSFLLIAFAVADLRPAGMPKALASSSVANEESSPTMLPSKIRSGVLYNLLAEDSQTSFAVASFDHNSNDLFLLGIPGVRPVSLSGSLAEKDSGVTIYANGLKLTLWKDTSPQSAQGVIMSGRFVDHSSGKEGRWILW